MEHSKLKIQNSKLESKTINLPMTREQVFSLKAGDMVSLNGRIVTGRDKVHKFLFSEKPARELIPFDLQGTVLYHCGPIVKKTPRGFILVAGGPTTSIRVEICEYRITPNADKALWEREAWESKPECHGNRCVYLHTMGGAAVFLADRVQRVIDVWKLEEFGMAEAMWLLEVKDFPAIVTMDTHGRSLHEEINRDSLRELEKLIGLE
jgi:tartrate/fumarate subfamily iron-sulfur-dependent hydro-lyase beta chain